MSGGDGQQSKIASGFSRSAAASAADLLEHGEHDGEGVLGERSGDDRFSAVDETEKEAVPVRDLVREIAGDHSRALRVESIGLIGDGDKADHVSRRRPARALFGKIEDRDRSRPRVEDHVIAADRRDFGPFAVEEGKGLGRGVDAPLGEFAGNEDAFAVAMKGRRPRP